jgi:hypothetical protein
VPNILVPLTPEQDRAVASLRNNDRIQPAEATRIIKSQDLQMMRAIDALKGRDDLRPTDVIGMSTR